MKWLLTGPHLSFDVESTGVNVETDRIVTACCALVNPGETPKVTTVLINPGVPIPVEATQVHGITTERARAEGVPPATGLAFILGPLRLALHDNIPIVGCNLAYDFTILDREMCRHNLRLMNPAALIPIVDVYVLDKHLDPYRRGGRRLTDLCANYEVRIDGAHDATFDALAAGRVAWRVASMTQWPNDRLLAHFGDPSRAAKYGARHGPQDIADRFLALSTSTPAQLHAAQVGWRAEQQAGLANHFAKLGRDVTDIYGPWPYIPAGTPPLQPTKKRGEVGDGLHD